MFFCKANEGCCKELKLILDKYEKASGQMISLQKSAITFGKKTPLHQRDTVKALLGISKEGGQGKYLGLPESFRRSKKDLFSIIVDRIRQKSVGWSTKRLSTAGKLTMIKSVLSAIPTYSMTCFKLPQSLCKRIQSALTRFWWDSNSGKKKMCFVSWRKLARSKRDGGLGLREINCFNDACLAKLSWRLLTRPDSLVAKVLLGKYCKDKHLLSVDPTTSCSHGWRGVLIGRDLLRTQLGKSLGNGKSTAIWSEAWLSTKEQSVPMGPPTEETKDLTVSYLLEENSNCWDLEKLQTLLPEYADQIRLLRSSSSDHEDAYVWLPCKSGEFSVKTGYHVAISIFDEHNPQHIEPGLTDFQWNQYIWNISTSPKLQVFLWKILQQAIPVGDCLLRRGLLESACCPRCGELETTEHVFLHCEFAIKVWRLLPFKTPSESSSFSDFQTALRASPELLCLPPSGVGTGPLFPWYCWSLWSARNHLIFENRIFSPEETTIKAIKDAREWQLAQLELKDPSTPIYQNSLVQILPPIDHNTIVAYSDAAWNATNQAGLGGVLLSSTGSEVARCSSTVPFVSSPLMAEALAILAVLSKTLEMGYTNIVIKNSGANFCYPD